MRRAAFFGLSVGNVITLPSLIIQHEFASRSYGSVVGLSTGVGQITFAFGPALLGLIRDIAGNYAPALVVCMVLEVAAAALILSYRPEHTKLAPTRSVRSALLPLLTRPLRHR